jgi:hypothetical protein
MTSFPPVPLPWSVVADRVHTWAVESQLGARRNAMVASTALAARRAERQDVDDFLDAQRSASRPSARAQHPVAARR